MLAMDTVNPEVAMRRTTRRLLLCSATLFGTDVSLGQQPATKTGISPADVRKVEDALITDPSGRRQGVPGIEVTLPRAETLTFRVVFDSAPPVAGARRRVLVYTYSAAPGANCDSVVCWRQVKQVSTAREQDTQSWSHRGKRGERLLITSWTPTRTLTRAGTAVTNVFASGDAEVTTPSASRGVGVQLVFVPEAGGRAGRTVVAISPK
jgi:hypothetical protein